MTEDEIHKKLNDVRASIEKIKLEFTEKRKTFVKREVYHKLTIPKIKSVADSQLLQVIFDNINYHIADKIELLKSLEKFSIEQRIFYAIMNMRATAYDNGLIRFFQNYSSNYIEFTIKAFSELEMDDSATIINVAFEKYRAAKDSQSNEDIEEEELDINLLNLEDTKFFEFQFDNAISEKLIMYIKTNKEKFVN